MGTTWSLPPMKQTEVDRALGRIGLAAHDPFRWEALQWFVGFAQRDLDAATEGDWLSLIEEIQALLRLITHQQLRGPLSRDDLRDLQEAALTVLTGLVEAGEAHIGPFKVSVFIRREDHSKKAENKTLMKKKTAGGPPQITRLGPILAFSDGPFTGHIPPGGLPGLQYHLAGLLMRFPETVQRCPKCHRLFARFRRHAKYCGRLCQSRFDAQKNRDKKKAEKKKLTKKRTKGAPR